MCSMRCGRGRRLLMMRREFRRRVRRMPKPYGLFAAPAPISRVPRDVWPRLAKTGWGLVSDPPWTRFWVV